MPSKNSLPRVLFIDDQLGRRTGKGRNPDREALCITSGVLDVTGDIEPEGIDNAVATATFYRGQTESGGVVENDLAGCVNQVFTGFKEAPRWALVFLDLHFKTGEFVDGRFIARDEEDRDPQNYFGLQVLRAIRDAPALSDLPIVILSSMERSDVEDVFAGLGVYDFCDKNSLDRKKMSELLDEHGLIEDYHMIGQSLSFLKCLREARRRARTGNDNILLFGETGTGKELLGRYIHQRSGREGRYIPLFTQGVPETLIEDRIFGHVKGAFAGADSNAPGAAESADGGTLFIDEFGDIPPSIQDKLLRLLDVNIRESQRLGSLEARKLDLQVVMATSRFGAGLHREDLLQRVKAEGALTLPPLRERREDIPVLIEFLVRKAESRLGAEKREIPLESVSLLQECEWPGNIREMARVLEQAVLQYRGIRVLAPQHLNLPQKAGGPSSSKPPEICEQDKSSQGTDPRLKPSLKDLLHSLRTYSYEEAPMEEIVGSYAIAEETTAKCLVGLLRRALELTRRPTPECPEGVVKYTPAVKLILGDALSKDAKSPKCADIVKKVMKLSPTVQNEALRDPVLSQVFDAAVNLRNKKKSKD